MHADDVIRQVNENARRMHGISELPTQEEIQNGLYQKRIEATKLAKQKELDQILNEAETYYSTLPPSSVTAAAAQVCVLTNLLQIIGKFGFLSHIGDKL